MKTYIKVFFITLISTLLVIGSVLAVYISGTKKANEKAFSNAKNDEIKIMETDDVELKYIDPNTLEGQISLSKRINVLLLGSDGGRADTIILASYDEVNKKLDFVTIPRDTYHEVPGYDALDQRKINAVYGFGEQDGGGRGMKAQVGRILGVPIQFYVLVDYRAMSDIVDTVGGVEVYIAEPMHYDDIMADPPLHIHFDEGYTELDGQAAIEYLRWRKNNGEYGAGDVPRTARQMEFLKELLSKALTSFKFDRLVETCYRYVSTDMPLTEALYYATTVFGFEPSEDMRSFILPGEVIFDGLSYYSHYPEETEKMMLMIYKNEPEKSEEEYEEEESDFEEDFEDGDAISEGAG